MVNTWYILQANSPQRAGSLLSARSFSKSFEDPDWETNLAALQQGSLVRHPYLGLSEDGYLWWATFQTDLIHYNRCASFIECIANWCTWQSPTPTPLCAKSIFFIFAASHRGTAIDTFACLVRAVYNVIFHQGMCFWERAEISLYLSVHSNCANNALKD